ncbi:MAG: hypothetical protein HYZ53_26260 [Planctomycetes bacterium]|nr:hypothetical protein [Planctomycetota bacterium]
MPPTKETLFSNSGDPETQRFFMVLVPDRKRLSLGLLLPLLAGLLVGFLRTRPLSAEEDWIDDPNQPLQIRARVGFDPKAGFCKANRWHPVVVEVRNTGDEVEGVVQVLKDTPDERGEETRYFRTLTLPKKSRKKVVFDCLLENGDRGLDVELLVRRSTAARYRPTLTLLGDDEDLIVALGDRAPAYQDLAPPRLSGSGQDARVAPRRRVLFAKPDHLPESWLACSAADTFFLDELLPSEVSEEKVAALRDYCLDGGTVVVCVGKLAQAYVGSPLASLLPVDLLGSRRADVKAALALVYGGPTPGPPAAGESEELLVAEGRPRPDAEVWLETVDRPAVPLVVRARLGLGQLLFFAFSPSEAVLSRSSGRLRLLQRALGHRPQKLLRHGWVPDALSSLLPVPGMLLRVPEGARPAEGTSRSSSRTAMNAFQPQGNDDATAGSLRDAVAGRFGDDFFLKIPPWQTVGLFLAAYVAVLVPINFWVFRRLDRVEWAWAAGIVITLAFAMGAQRLGHVGTAASIKSVLVSVLEAGPGAPTGSASSFLGLYTEGRVEEDLTFDGGPTFPCRLRSRETLRGLEREAFHVDEQDAPVLRHFNILPRATRSFEAARLVPLGDGFVAQIGFGERVDSLRLENHSPFDLHDVLVLAGEQGAWEIGDLASGARHEGTPRPQSPDERKRATEAWRERAAAARTSRILESLARAAMQDQQAARRFQVLAWLETSPISVRLAGEPVTGLERTLVRVPLDLRFSKGAVRLGRDFWHVRVLRAPQGAFEWQPDGHFSLGGPGEANTAELEFTPKAWPDGMTVQGLSCEAAGPSGFRYRILPAETVRGLAEPTWLSGPGRASETYPGGKVQPISGRVLVEVEAPGSGWQRWGPGAGPVYELRLEELKGTR